jgi:hypothetical protein
MNSMEKTDYKSDFIYKCYQFGCWFLLAQISVNNAGRKFDKESYQKKTIKIILTYN